MLRVETGNAIRYRNLLKEALKAQEEGDYTRSGELLDQARSILHDDPKPQPQWVQDAWKEARGMA